MEGTDPRRRKDLSRIHIMKKELGLDDDCYRELLKGVTGKDSAKALDAKERWRVMCEMARLCQSGGGACGASPPGPPAAGAQGAPVGRSPSFASPHVKPKYPGRPAVIADKERQIGKIEAVLADMKLGWGYAHAIAKKQWGIDMVQWCDADQLRGVIAALVKHQRRQEAKAVAVPSAGGAV